MTAGGAGDDPFTLLGIDRSATAGDVHRARRRLAKRLHPDRGGDATAMQAINAAADAALVALTAPTPPPPPPRPPDEPRRRWRAASDSPSFTVEALPAETFEALVVVANWLGDVLVDDPPYALESHLVAPFDCWCRLDLLPDAGASTVSITVATVDGDGLPDVEAVRDEWIANLNRLDWGRIGPTPQRP